MLSLEAFWIAQARNLLSGTQLLNPVKPSMIGTADVTEHGEQSGDADAADDGAYTHDQRRAESGALFQHSE
jgi:hypothetical protein